MNGLAVAAMAVGVGFLLMRRRRGGSAPAGRRYRAEDASGVPRARIEFDYGLSSGAADADIPVATPAPVAQPRPVKPPSVSIASPLDVRPTAGPRPVTRRLNPIAPPPENTATALSWLDPLDLLGLPATPGRYAGNY